MKNFTKYAYGIIGFTLVAFMILLNGCTSPDTTTGKLAYQSKDYTKAEEYLERGLSLDKEDAEGWYMLGYSQVELGLQMNDYKKIDKAETSFQNCQRITSNYGGYIFNFWVDKFNASAEYFKSGNKAGQDTSLANRNYREAIKFSYTATKILPDTLKSYRIMGLSYYAMGDLDKGIETYANIISKPNSNNDDIETYAEIMYNKGLVQRNALQYEISINTFEAVTKIKGLAKDNTYYEGSVLNLGISNYQLALKTSQENGDFKPFLTKCTVFLEPLAKSTKNKKILEQTYQFLEESFAALGNEAKSTEYKTLREGLNK